MGETGGITQSVKENTTSLPSSDNRDRVKSRRTNYGDKLQIQEFDNDHDDNEVDIPPQNELENPQQVPQRYPQRTRRNPDRFAPLVSH